MKTDDFSQTPMQSAGTFLLERLSQNRYWAVAALVVEAEAIFEWAMNPPTTMIAWLLSVAYMLLLLVMPVWLVPASIGQVFFFFLNVLFPAIDGPSQAFGVWFSIIILGCMCKSVWYSVIAVFFSLIAVGVNAFLFPDETGIGSVVGLLAYDLVFVFAAIAGRALRWKNNANHAVLAEQKYAQLRHNIITASQIHDTMSERVSRLILVSQIQEMNADEKDKSIWHMMAQSLQDVLDDMHTAIDHLENSSSGTSIESIPIMEAIDKTVKVCEQYLHECGYSGSAVFSGICTAKISDFDVDVISLLQELYDNITRHCDPKSGDFQLSIEYSEQAITILQSNSTVHSKGWREMPQSGNGLRLHRKILEGIGGRLIANEKDNVWSVVLYIPVKSFSA